MSENNPDTHPDNFVDWQNFCLLSTTVMLSKETLLSQEQQQQPEIAVADFSIPLYLSNRSVVFNFICTIALPYSNFV